LEGVVESAAAFWEAVNCDGEKSGWLNGIIFPVTSGGGMACGWADEMRGSMGWDGREGISRERSPKGGAKLAGDGVKAREMNPCFPPFAIIMVPRPRE